MNQVLESLFLLIHFIKKQVFGKILFHLLMKKTELKDLRSNQAHYQLP